MNTGEKQINIRKFQAKDRMEVRRLVCSTALMGGACNQFFEGEEVFADAASVYFTDHEPESSYVAVEDKKVVGYLLGSVNAANMSRIFGKKLVAPLVLKALAQGIFLKKRNIVFLGRCLSSALKGEFYSPDFRIEYPATLHINIEEKYRGLKIGDQLIGVYLDYLRKLNARGVHLATMSDKAGRFFVRNGFKLLFEGKRSYFRHILYKDVTLYVYGLKFTPAQ